MEEKYIRKFKEYNKKLFSYKGRNVWDIEHSVERFNERFPKYTFEDYKRIVEKGIDNILSVLKDSKGKYLIVSRSKDIAIQLEWRRDNKHDDGKNHVYSATTLDYESQKKVIKGDTKLFVEDFKKYDIQKWFENNSNRQIMQEVGYYGLPLSEECKDYEVYVSFGKISRNFEIIEVD